MPDPIKQIRILLIALTGFCFTHLSAQDTFVFKGDTGTAGLLVYKTALNKAKMEPYRLRNSRAVLVFENVSFTVELLSATELMNMGKRIIPADYPLAFPITFEMPLFSVSADGWLLARYSNKSSKFH